NAQARSGQSQAIRGPEGVHLAPGEGDNPHVAHACELRGQLLEAAGLRSAGCGSSFLQPGSVVSPRVGGPVDHDAAAHGAALAYDRGELERIGPVGAKGVGTLDGSMD